MKKSLYLKFVLAYVIFGFFSFIVVATFSSSLINERVKSENAESLYAEASMVSKTYAAELYNNEITIESAYHQLHALGTYLSSTIWLVNPSEQYWLIPINSRMWQIHRSLTILHHLSPLIPTIRPVIFWRI